MYDFAFLAPCPASGLFVHGTRDQVVPEADVQKLVDRLRPNGVSGSVTGKSKAPIIFSTITCKEVIEIVAEYVKNRMESPYGGS